MDSASLPQLRSTRSMSATRVRPLGPYYLECERKGQVFRVSSLQWPRRLIKWSMPAPSSHSQITTTFHPRSSRALWFVLSRSMFLAIFITQYSRFDEGLCPSRQSCPCQKQPFTTQPFLAEALCLGCQAGLSGAT